MLILMRSLTKTASFFDLWTRIESYPVPRWPGSCSIIYYPCSTFSKLSKNRMNSLRRTCSQVWSPDINSGNRQMYNVHINVSVEFVASLFCSWPERVAALGTPAVASWLECSTPDRVVRVRVLAGKVVLCSWARHFTLTVPLSPRCISEYQRI